MNRLQSEQHRLFLPASPAGLQPGAPPSPLLDTGGSVRAMVLELTRPPSWRVLSTVWHGVQDELDLPAPAIAVSGVDGLQLWFSLAEPITAARAHAFLESLCARFLPDTDPARLRLLPAAGASQQRHGAHAPLVPALQTSTGNWSAFVAPDLAPVFDETPWLDIAPNDEGQAALLSGLVATTAEALALATKRLESAAHRAHATEPGRTNAAMAVAAEPAMAMPMPTAVTDMADDATRFLRRVMNDDTVPMALRIDAAKALLQHAPVDRPSRGD
jgi:hypothetical protein